MSKISVKRVIIITVLFTVIAFLLIYFKVPYRFPFRSNSYCSQFDLYNCPFGCVIKNPYENLAPGILVPPSLPYCRER